MSLMGIGPISAMQGSCGTAGAWRRWSLANVEEKAGCPLLTYFCRHLFWWGERRESCSSAGTEV